MIFVPLFSLLPAVILAHAVLGPLGWWIGTGLSNIVYTGLTSALSGLFAAAFAFVYAPLVITGLHHMTNAIDLQLMADFGGTNLWPMIALSNIAQGSAVLAIVFLNRGNKKEEQVSIPATISAYLGVTEPAMFGIHLKYLYPFLSAMIGSSVADTISTLMGVTVNSIGAGGIPGILAIQPHYWFGFTLAMTVAIGVSFALTIFFRNINFLQKKDDQSLSSQENVSKQESVLA